MNKRLRNGLMALGAAGVVILMLLGFQPGIISTIAGPPPEAPKAGQVCADVDQEPVFLAYDERTKFPNFGPPVDARELDPARAELQARRCVDAALTTAHAMVWQIPGFETIDSEEQFQAKVNELRNEDGFALWRDTIRKMEEVESAAAASIETITEPSWVSQWFDTAGLQPDQVPVLHVGPVPGGQTTVIAFLARDGKKAMFRLECGFQPLAPQLVGKPGLPPPPPPTTPSTTSPPPTGGGEHRPPPPTTGPCVGVNPPGDGVYVPAPPPECWEKVAQTFEKLQNDASNPSRQSVQDNQSAQQNGVDTGPTRDGAGKVIPNPAPARTSEATDATQVPPAPGGYVASDGTAPAGTATDSAGTIAGATTEIGGESDGVDNGSADVNNTDVGMP